MIRCFDLPHDIVPQYWLLVNGQRLGRFDLRFKHRFSQRDYFAFESKRLHVTYPGGKLSPEYHVYAGGDGMGGFIEGQYSTGLPAAGMLGYIMDGDTKKAWAGLATRIEAKRDGLCLLAASRFIESSLKHHIESGLSDTRLGETQHTLVSHVLRLFHLLLPVRRHEFDSQVTAMIINPRLHRIVAAQPYPLLFATSAARSFTGFRRRTRTLICVGCMCCRSKRSSAWRSAMKRSSSR